VPDVEGDVALPPQRNGRQRPSLKLCGPTKRGRRRTFASKSQPGRSPDRHNVRLPWRSIPRRDTQKSSETASFDPTTDF
jgi:hypothetical protein